MTRHRVSIDDLGFAVAWLDAYEAQEDDDNGAAAVRVIAWLSAEIGRRRDEAAVRSVTRQTGTTAAQARAALRRVRNPRPSS